MSLANVYGWPGTLANQNEGSLQIFLWAIAGLCDVSQRSPQGAAWEQLLTVPQLLGLESGQAVRPFKNTISAHGSAYASGLREVPQT